MAKFRIQPHGRLQEWVAEEQGYFGDEGLDYEFVFNTGASVGQTVQSADGVPHEVVRGAFESMEAGRACEVSSACHWAVNMASSAEHGRMWRQAYSVTLSGICVPPESPIRTPDQLANVEIGVGYHSGSHFSALQALEGILAPEAITFRFVGLPLDRLRLMLERQVAAANMFGVPLSVLEQQGFRKVVDTTFMIGFLVAADADLSDVERYFRALRRAQRDIDQAPERYRHYFLKELPAAYHELVDVRAFGLGERLVFEPYTREIYEKTHRWMEAWKLFPEAQAGRASYEAAVVG